MAIGDGRKVKIKFTQPLIGNVLGLNPPYGYKQSKINLYEAKFTALNSYANSFYDISNVKNGVLTDYWYGTTAVNWIKIKLKEPKIVTSFRMYLGSYYIKTFTISGSKDGSEWVQIGDVLTAATSSTTQWYNFVLDNSEEYLYYKIDTLTAYDASRIYLYELELYETKPIGNESKFKILFDEYDCVPEGTLRKVEREVELIEAVSAFNDTIDLSKGNGNNVDCKDNVLTLKPTLDESNFRISLVNQNQYSSNGATTCSLTMNNCTIGNILILAYAVRTEGNIPILTEGWTILGGGNNTSDSSAISSDGIDQKLYFAFKKVTSSTEKVVITQSVTSRIYAVCSEYSGIGEVLMRNDLASIGNVNYTVYAEKTNASDKMLYGVTATYYGSGRNQTVTPNDLVKIQGDSSAERLACWFDDGSGEIEHTFVAYNSGEARDAVLECVELKEQSKEYFQDGQVEFLIENLVGFGSITDSVISWDANVPENTSLKVFVKTNSEYVECSNGSEISVLKICSELPSNSLTIKVEMSTNNINLTPSIKNLKILLKTSGDENYITLVLPKGNINSFQNTVGEITVSYDGSGTLMGLGGPVAAFDISFMPEDLDYKGHQHDAEHMVVENVNVNANLMKIYYKQYGTPDEHLEISNISAIGTLISVDDI